MSDGVRQKSSASFLKIDVLSGRVYNKLLTQEFIKMSNDLEKEFEVLYLSIGEEISKKIKRAEQLLAEAEDLADKFGIPFQADMYSNMRGWYVPESFAERFKSLDVEKISELTEISAYRLNRAYGWQHSNIC